MAFFEFPHTRTYDSDLGWLIQNVLELRNALETLKAEFGITVADPVLWDITKQYIKYSFVIDDQGTGYISMQPVPAGIALTNTDYWQPVFNYGGEIQDIKDAIDALEHDVEDISDTLDPIPGEITDMQGQIGDLETTVAALDARSLDPDDFTGDTDAEKLQAAIDYACDNYYPTITLSREYDITGSTLYIDKGLYISNDDYLRYRAKLTFIGVNGGRIVKGDGGYFFSSHERSGDIAFINVQFRGNVVLTGPDGDDILARKVGNIVFNCSALLRITTINCSYTLVRTVFANITATDPLAENIQSNQNFGDTLTYSDSFYYVRTLWDVHVIGCTIENCNVAIRHDVSSPIDCQVNLLNFVDCTIESCHEGGIALASTDPGDRVCYINQLNVCRCYFESCGTYMIDLRNQVRQAHIDSNRFAFNSASERGVYITSLGPGNSINNNYASGTVSARIAEITAANENAKVYMYDNTLNNSSASNDQNIGVQPHVNGMIKKFPTVPTGVTDANDVINIVYDGFMRISSSDTIANTPVSNVNALLRWTGDGGNIIQIFAVNENNARIYMRVRGSGLGWSTWRQLDT